MASLAHLMSRPQISSSLAAQQKTYVTYTAPLSGLNAPTVIIREARALIACSGTTGRRTWEAALHLASFLVSSGGKSLVLGKSIIELGAGTGFLSILCAKFLGAKHILATDGSEEVVDDLKSNLRINGLEGSYLFDTAVLRWDHSLPLSLSASDSDFQCYDLILGADIVSQTFYDFEIS